MQHHLLHCCLLQCVSTMANMSLQEVAAQAHHPCMLFQLYVIRDRQIVEGWVRQAEAAGYKALVVTVDAPRLGRREADERNRWAAWLWHLKTPVSISDDQPAA
jgi:isopentenyl diphosphate isomerase/L-lactate dehydrogenase-like FMN-dependent dehydrogenase